MMFVSVKTTARDYGEMITKIGPWVDAVCGNGNWGLIECNAQPNIMVQDGPPVTWEFDVKIEWYGQAPRDPVKPLAGSS